jgi:hypothetical protein
MFASGSARVKLQHFLHVESARVLAGTTFMVASGSARVKVQHLYMLN